MSESREVYFQLSQSTRKRIEDLARHIKEPMIVYHVDPLVMANQAIADMRSEAGRILDILSTEWAIPKNGEEGQDVKA